MPKYNSLWIGSFMINALKSYLKYTEVMQVLLGKVIMNLLINNNFNIFSKC